jgi:flagellar hook protein FlgE
MSLFGALNTAVSGLRAQSYALENISGNIANSQTIGFKRTDTRFEELVPDAPIKRQVAGAVIASSSATNTVQGDIQAAGISTYMAINGQGFFMVQQPNGFVDGRATFDSLPLYTRRGDFQIDSDGYLVNGGGYYLMGSPVDPKTGNSTGSAPQVLQFRKQLLPATPTTQITYHANLPTDPSTLDKDPLVANSELLDDTAYSSSPLGTGFVAGDDAELFLKESISGGAITTFDPLGSPVNVQLRWAKIDSTGNGGANTWNLFYQVDGTAAGANPAWQNVGVDYIFDASGQLDPAVPSIDITNMTIDGVNLGTIKLVHDANGAGQPA